MTKARRAELEQTRERLNRMGDNYTGIFVDEERGLALDTNPRNNGASNRKRIRVRNKINARLRSN